MRCQWGFTRATSRDNRGDRLPDGVEEWNSVRQVFLNRRPEPYESFFPPASGSTHIDATMNRPVRNVTVA
jgi:hypothetical protein